ncbi:rCG63669 [Rattus norvegicus]|uniref:RCG63669 n=1 Tax=Rattus norvegicus TaxID=10116 RepID=A6IY17_RAT|nr:rCG63669 [Rattus norvegicus]
MVFFVLFCFCLFVWVFFVFLFFCFFVFFLLRCSPLIRIPSSPAIRLNHFFPSRSWGPNSGPCAC